MLGMTGEARMFNRNSFSPISFSRTAWAGIQQSQQEGRSGYWRLFYHQLQEAALNKEKIKPIKVEEVKFEPYTEQPDGSVIFGKPKIKAKVVPAVDTAVENYVAETMRVHHQVQMLIARLSVIETRGVSVQLPLWMEPEKLVVDEEDEEELIILLMN